MAQNEWERKPQCCNLWRRHSYTRGAAYNGRVRIKVDACVRCGKPKGKDKKDGK